MNKHIKIQISGKVQGVWFRDTARQIATKFDLVGYAKNNSDGSVTIEACGNETGLQQLLSWSKEGSKLANVENVDFNINDKCGDYEGFSIL